MTQQTQKAPEVKRAAQLRAEQLEQKKYNTAVDTHVLERKQVTAKPSLNDQQPRTEFEHQAVQTGSLRTSMPAAGPSSRYAASPVASELSRRFSMGGVSSFGVRNANFKMESLGGTPMAAAAKSKIQTQSPESKQAAAAQAAKTQAHKDGQNADAQKVNAREQDRDADVQRRDGDHPSGVDPKVQEIENKGQMAGGAIQGADVLNQMHGSQQKKKMQQQFQAQHAQQQNADNQMKAQVQKTQAIQGIANQPLHIST